MKIFSRYEIIFLAVFVFSLPLSISAAEINSAHNSPGRNSQKKEKIASSIREQAIIYRNQGFELQNTGNAQNIETAKSFYQKAIQLDPTYAVPYNDLGVIYEASGLLDYAEQSYLMAIRMDPNYLSAYSNLAAIYESKGDLEKAYSCWKLRADYGSPRDMWTQKAGKKVDELSKKLPSLRQQFIQQQTMELSREISEQKKLAKLNDLKEAKRHISLANSLYNKRDYRKTIDELNIALLLDPHSEDAVELMQLVEIKLAQEKKRIAQEKERIAREKEIEKRKAVKEANLKKINDCLKVGVKYYQQDNPQAAEQEFRKIAQICASPQQ